VAAGAVLLCGVWGAPRSARACAPAPPAGEQVATAREDALIVWDAANHREHFVRRAIFGGVTQAFGFLVPTPAQPELEEASEEIFGALERLTEPSVVVEPHWVAAPVGCTLLPWLLLRSGSKAEELPQATSVSVLEQKRVSGLDATVLAAGNADALAAWLESRGFALRPALKAWVEPYLARGWKITAFRYPGDARLPDGTLGSRALRMSFAADEPVYPYREPEDQLTLAGRELRLFLLAETQLEAGSSKAIPAWAAAMRFSAHVPLSPVLERGLSGVALPRSAWLVEFRDRTRRRPPEDLAFVAASTPREVRPEPRVVTQERPVPLPYEAPVVLGGLAFWWRRRRAAAR
jgi:hypothetical protein